MTTRDAQDRRLEAERGPAQVVSVRFAPEELGRLKQIAEAEQIPLSAVIRRAVLSTSAGPGVVSQSPQSMNMSGVGLVGGYTVSAGTAIATVGKIVQFNVQFDGGAGAYSTQ